MSNLETLNQIKPKLKPEELETVDALRKELEQKVEKMNAVLKDLDNVINDASVSKETKLQAEEKFQQLESAKKVLSEKMSDPIIPIDETVTAPTIPEEPQAPKKLILLRKCIILLNIPDQILNGHGAITWKYFSKIKIIFIPT
jgi:uncharacterized protein (UPF0147 family)